jgi:DNA helicase HerA-like ATPase
MSNRHGLIAGATGTGKTRTLQAMAEQFSAAGVPVFLADIKGDLSGLGLPGTSSAQIEERCAHVGQPFKPAGCPVQFLSLTGTQGVQLRATVSSFGPLLLGRVLDLNATQQSALAMVFKFCDDQGLLLLDLPDLKETLQYLIEHGAEHLKEYGGLSKATVGVLVRKLVELEQQGADAFFGEPEYDIDDLIHVEPDGRGRVSVLELSDLQDRPALFSTFMMWLLASLYREMPEAGDLPKPKLVFFFDEAHNLFEGGSKAFEEQIEQVVRLIRSKGVGVYFVTQTPKDIPADVLAQLGNRVQHALRAFTPDDEKAIKATARTMPKSGFYDVADVLTKLGIGEALVTLLDPRGVPTPVVATRMLPPCSSMSPMPAPQLQAVVQGSPLLAEYGQRIDRESAREMLTSRMERSQQEAEMAAAEQRKFEQAEADAKAAETGRGGRRAAAADNPAAAIGKAVNSPLGRAVGRELVRGLFGVFGVKTSRRRGGR